MSEQTSKPDFDSIRQATENGIEYWSARDLAPLLGYASSWQNFEVAVKRAKTTCEQIQQPIENHFNGAIKMVVLGSGAKRNIKDYRLSRFGAYLIAQNGDPRKPEIAAAQAYFATAARENELAQQLDQRLELRYRLEKSNEALEAAAYNAGVLPRSFGLFHRAGYEGLYNGLAPDELKKLKGIEAKENLLDRMGETELAANYFRTTQARGKLEREGIIGQTNAMEAHRKVGETVRKAIDEIGGILPENLPAEPSIKPLLKGQRKKNQLPPEANESDK